MTASLVAVHAAQCLQLAGTATHRSTHSTLLHRYRQRALRLVQRLQVATSVHRYYKTCKTAYQEGNSA